MIHLKHDELKEMGITSVGHRLTILKGVYEMKTSQDIHFDSDHYVPLCKPLEMKVCSGLTVSSGRTKQAKRGSYTGGCSTHYPVTKIKG